MLLGLVVEKIAGRPFKEHVARTLLLPLGMGDTWFHSDHLTPASPPPAPMVRGYLLATPELRAAIIISRLFRPVAGVRQERGVLLDSTLAAARVDAAGGLVTTLPDLAKFATARFRGRLLSRRSQEFMLSAGKGILATSTRSTSSWTR